LEAIIHKRFSAFEEIMPKWGRLKREFYEVTVFQDIGWLKRWWEYNCENNKVTPYIVEVRKSNNTIGIIPFYIIYKHFKNTTFRLLKPFGSYESDYLVPLISKKYSAEKILKIGFKKMQDDKGNWDCIMWNDVPENSFFESILAGNLLKGNRLIQREKGFVCPFVTIGQDFNKIKQGMNQQFVGQILSKQRRLGKKGELKFCKVANKQEIEYVMNKLFEFHIERWMGTNTPSRFQSRKEKEHYLHLAQTLFENNLLHLTYLMHNNEIVSVHFGMSDKERLYFYIPAFNINFKRYSVGSILLYRLILLAFEEKLKTFEFLRGDEAYKYSFGAVEKYNSNYLIFNYSLRSLLYKKICNSYLADDFQESSVVRQLLIKAFITVSAIFLDIFNDSNTGNLKS